MGIQERFGNFVGILPPGLNCIMWPIDNVVGRVSARVQQLVCDCGTKTKDNVFVSVQVIVQYQVIVTQAYDAYYKLTDPNLQIRSYVEDIVRSTVPRMELDSAFEAKEELAHAIRDSLQQTMGTYGYTIIQSLVVDIRVDEKVKTAMNEINAAKRLREAAAEKAEADKIVQVKAAEASAESKYLSGMGIARERKAIVDGLRGSVEEFSEVVDGATPKDVMDLILLTQYFDMLKDVGSNPSATTLFMNHGPSAVTELKEQLKEGIMTKATTASS
ncbi:hypothetical protein VYU27_005494 [Nannochloropsis oceanica]